MRFFTYFKRNFERTNYAVNVMPPPRQVIDVNRQAISIAAVYRSVSILSTAVSQMAGGVYKGDQLIRKPSWLYAPDPTMSGMAFTEGTVTSLALHGNAYWKVYRNHRNEPIALSLLDPTYVEVVKKDGDILFYYEGVLVSDIQHLQLLRLPGQIKGLGPLQAARLTFEGQIRLQDFQNTWFDTRVPQAYLKSDQALSKDSAERYEARWNEKLKTGNTPVLGQGLELKSMLINPKDALFIEVAGYNISEIGRLWGIPPHYLGVGIEGSSLTYTTSVDLDIQFLRYTVTQYVTEIEEAISALLPRGTSYSFDTSSLLRTNDKQRYEAYKIAIEAGWMLPEEVRKVEGLPQLSGSALSEQPPSETQDLLTNNQGD